MPCGEGVSAAGFKVAFKGLCLCEAGAEVGSAADVALVGMGDAAENVSVVHGDIPLDVSVGVFLVELVLLCSLFYGLSPPPLFELRRAPSFARRPPSEGWWRWELSNGTHKIGTAAPYFLKVPFKVSHLSFGNANIASHFRRIGDFHS